jgi:NAD(P)-dependent dehydrogenase (short-subunit alcohol dehydrogenase family)
MENDRISSAQRVAVVAGATGLVGGELLQHLLVESGYRLLIALARRPLALTNPRLVLADANFDQLDQMLAGQSRKLPRSASSAASGRRSGSPAAKRRFVASTTISCLLWACGPRTSVRGGC